ncbi:putative leucine aminopeptidase 2 [Marasmius fiardii PR-910]|nr:putative leucine aminopeptidase 2 [Marasmius fiardii PR-910]
MIKSSFAVVTLLAVSLTSALTVNERNLARRDLVDSEKLRSQITPEALLQHAQVLQNFAFATPERNRLVGGVAHNQSVQYFYDTLTGLGDYYNVTLQPFSVLAYTAGNFSLNVDGAPAPANVGLFEYSPNGNVTESLVPVANLGCSAEDYSADVAGKVALISRGECAFGDKSALAGSAGAVGAIIYNNVAGEIGSGTLGPPPNPNGNYVPTVGVNLATGTGWLEAIQGGANVTATIVVDGSVTETRFTNNVIAETKGGNHSDVVFFGAHSDSVAAGPGINDNGSGSIALLEIAKQLVEFDVNNAVRFAWWSAEEEGLLGSEHWVTTASQEELEKVRLYLNFDMIASPNYALNAYDGDGSTFGEVGPPGSAEAEKLFHDYFASVGLNSTDSEFNGRSDYGPFLEVGIASGGIDTGAEGIKTEEEAEKFGGEAGVAYDVNYHQAGDTIDNLAHDAFEANTKAIAHAAAVYGASFESLPPKGAVQKVAARSADVAKKPLKIWKGDWLIA